MEGETANPINFQLNFSRWDWAKTVIFGILLVPLRVFCFTVLMATGWLWFLMRTTILVKVMPQNGLTWIELEVLARISRLVALSFGVHVEVKGEPCPRDEARILVAAPHSTAFDSFILGASGRFPTCIAKAYAFDLPFFGKSNF